MGDNTTYGTVYQSLCLLLQEGKTNTWTDLASKDWNLFQTIAMGEGVAPLIFSKLEQCGWSKNVPEFVITSLEREYYISSAQNSMLYNELCSVLRLFRNNNIPVIVLKGAALGIQIYADPATRPMGDIDLLVLKKDLTTASSVLGTINYQRVDTERVTGLETLIGNEFKFINSKFNTAIDLHWRLIASESDWRSPPPAWFWSQIEEHEISIYSDNKNLSCLLLNPHALLLYLSAHLMLQHGIGQGRLIWYYDIKKVVHRYRHELDWDQLIIDARMLHWLEALDYALKETKYILGTQSIEDLSKLKIKPDEKAERYIRSKPHLPNSNIYLLIRRFKTLSWLARIFLLLSILFPSPNHLRKRYRIKSKFIVFLYYPYRWLEIIVETWKYFTIRQQL